MNSVKTNYPALTALLALVGGFAEDVSSSASLMAKLAGLANLLPGAITFEGLAAQLQPEIAAIEALDTAEKAVVAAGVVELLITDLGFSSPQAQKAQAAGFALAEWLVAGVPAIQAIVALKK